MSPRVDITFTGSARGALAAARQTSTGIEQVDRSAKGANRTLATTERNLNATARGAIAGSGAFRGLGRMVAFASASFLGGAGLIMLLRTSKDAASNLFEQIDKAHVVFGGAGNAIVAWSKTTAQGLGIASDQALEFAGIFGNMLVPMGFAREAAAKMSRGMVELAADMASFNNASPEETLEALRSGLSGETEPLRRFGVFLNEARIKQEALSSGLIKGKQELTAAGKAQAIYQIILKDTTDAHGNYQKTIDGAANSERRRNALLRESAITIGKALLPVYTQVTNAVADWLGKTENQKKIQEAANRAIEIATGLLRAFIAVARPTAQIAGQVAKAVGGWENAFKIALAGWVFVKLLQLRRSFLLLAGAQGIAGATGALGPGKGGLLGAIRALPKSIHILVVLAGLAAAYKGLQALFAFAGVQSGSIDVSGTNALAKIIEEKTGGKLTIRDGKIVSKKGWRKDAFAPLAPLVGMGAATPLPSSFRDDHGSREKTAFPGTSQTQSPSTDAFFKPNTVVGAPAAGVITRTSGSKPGYDSAGEQSYGFSLYLEAAGGGGTYYMTHFASLLVGQGDKVERGTPIGTVARWGTGSHIHIEHLRGEKVTPDTGTVFATDPATSSTKGGADAGTGSPPLFPGEQKLETRLADARTTPRLSDDLQALLAMRNAIAKARKGAKGERRQQLSEALKDVQDDIADIRGQIVEKARAERERLRAALRHVDLVRTVMEEVFGVSETRERGGELRNRLARMGNDALQGLLAALREARAAGKQEANELLNALSEPFRQPAKLMPLDQLRQRIEELKKIIATGTREAVARARKELRALAPVVSASVEAAQSALEAKRDSFRSAFQRIASRILEGFDRETQRTLKNMRKQVDSQLAAIRRQAEGQTGSESALGALREQRRQQALDRQRADLLKQLAEAETPEERVRIQQQLDDMLLDEQERLLELQAAAERKALEESIERQAQAVEEAAELAEQSYTDARDAQRRALEDELAAWLEALETRKKTWEEFMAWLVGVEGAPGVVQQLGLDPAWLASGQAAGSAWVTGFLDELSKLEEALDALAAGAGSPFGSPPGGGGGGGPFPMQQGGRVPGVYVGREDTVLVAATPGETMIDRSLTTALEAAFLSGGGNRPVQVSVVLEIDGQRVSQALARPMTTELSRFISYRIER